VNRPTDDKGDTEVEAALYTILRLMLHCITISYYVHLFSACS